MTKEIEIPEGCMARIEGNKVIIEPKDSEDERIIKAIKGIIVEWFSKTTNTFTCKVDEEELFAWLEKKKEQKTIQSDTEKQYVRTLESLISDFLHGKQEVDRDYYQQICDWLEERHIEQKSTEQYSIGKTFTGLIPCWVNAPSELQPAHKYHGRNAVIMHESNGGFRCCFIDNDKPTTIHLPENTAFVEGWRKEPAEWNEEDKTNGWTGADLERYLSCLQRLGTGDPQQPLTINSKWFKEHCHPQQRQEWSEEDEGMYELFSYVIELVEDCQDKEKVKNWIKEIKERFTNSDYRSVGLHYILKNNHKSWKPSEEQMEALSDAFAEARTFKMGSILESLYNDLELLKNGEDNKHKSAQKG